MNAWWATARYHATYCNGELFSILRKVYEREMDEEDTVDEKSARTKVGEDGYGISSSPQSHRLLRRAARRTGMVW
ncbi:hypothetical protein E2562_011457 [Oryza meyeriana var. granulata]|uniref:Uncharacterized protein n=1 Tax=Oryza meyeriana var. granulata TaxID=110450 RepID=A0A6G1D418_9ORYZ|nr:hypothetical protein E2562_011457 [Oryza meyeriana var. granulata]